MTTSTSRREFLASMGGLAAAGFLPRVSFARMRVQELHFANKAVRGSAYVIGDLTSGGNVLAVPSGAGPIIIDAKHAHTASLLAHDVERLMSKPAAFLINTHHHADHSGGNWAFSEHATIIAHKNLNPRLESNLSQYARQAEGYVAQLEREGAADEKINAARETLEKIKSLKAEHFRAKKELPDGDSIHDYGNVKLQCYHFGNGHTDNDLVIFIPSLNVIHAGDLLFHNLHPFIDRSAKANTRGWQQSLKRVLELGDDDTIVVPGHGEVTDKTALTRQIEYFDQLREIVSKAIEEGKSREEVIAMKPDAFKAYGFDQIRPITFGGMYDELMDEKKQAAE